MKKKKKCIELSEHFSKINEERERHDKRDEKRERERERERKQPRSLFFDFY
jgi:hypothetical protein